MRVIFLYNKTSSHPTVFQPKVIEAMKQVVPNLDEKVYTYADLLADPTGFSDVDMLFSTWGMPALKEEELESILPNLKCVFYAAGSVQGFARPFLNRGIKVISAWAANAVPVAEYSTAQIILANKGFFGLSRLLSHKNLNEAHKTKHSYPGNFKEKIGLLGCGMIGSHVAELLQQYALEVLVFDPFISDEKAERLKVKKCSLEEIFSTCSVISNHLASNKETKGMLRYEHFSLMRPYSTFINTGRGAQVIEADLVRVLKERPDVSALLDVTDPEPSPLDHPFYDLPNCFLTPHIAGNIIANEQARMAEYMLNEYKCFMAGEPCKYEVTKEMLLTMA